LPGHSWGSIAAAQRLFFPSSRTFFLGFLLLSPFSVQKVSLAYVYYPFFFSHIPLLRESSILFRFFPQMTILNDAMPFALPHFVAGVASTFPLRVPSVPCSEGRTLFSASITPTPMIPLQPLFSTARLSPTLLRAFFIELRRFYALPISTSECCFRLSSPDVTAWLCPCYLLAFPRGVIRPTPSSLV